MADPFLIDEGFEEKLNVTENYKQTELD